MRPLQLVGVLEQPLLDPLLLVPELRVLAALRRLHDGFLDERHGRLSSVEGALHCVGPHLPLFDLMLSGTDGLKEGSRCTHCLLRHLEGGFADLIMPVLDTCS